MTPEPLPESAIEADKTCAAFLPINYPDMKQYFSSPLKGLLPLAYGIFFLIAPVAMASAQAQDIHQFIDRWHEAASKANAGAFFGSMAENSIYIGTDAKERWTKKEFITFAKPYFDKGKAWDFKPYDRDLHLSEDGRYVWFSELLTTWMGVCRGSGVLVKSADGWQIEQYHLSVTVPNEVINDFITLVDKFSKQQK